MTSRSFEQVDPDGRYTPAEHVMAGILQFLRHEGYESVASTLSKQVQAKLKPTQRRLPVPFSNQMLLDMHALYDAAMTSESKRKSATVQQSRWKEQLLKRIRNVREPSLKAFTATQEGTVKAGEVVHTFPSSHSANIIAVMHLPAPSSADFATGSRCTQGFVMTGGVDRTVFIHGIPTDQLEYTVPLMSLTDFASPVLSLAVVNSTYDKSGDRVAYTVLFGLMSGQIEVCSLVIDPHTQQKTLITVSVGVDSVRCQDLSPLRMKKWVVQVDASQGSDRQYAVACSHGGHLRVFHGASSQSAKSTDTTDTKRQDKLVFSHSALVRHGKPVECARFLSQDSVIFCARGDNFLYVSRPLHTIAREVDSQEAKGEKFALSLDEACVHRVNLNTLGDTHVSFSVYNMCMAPVIWNGKQNDAPNSCVLALASNRHSVLLVDVPLSVLTLPEEDDQKSGDSEQNQDLPNGALLATSIARHIITVFGFRADEYSSPRLAFSPGGRFLYVTSQDNGIYAYDASSGTLEGVLSRGGECFPQLAHTKLVRDIMCLPQSAGDNDSLSGIISVSYDRDVKLWKM